MNLLLSSLAVLGLGAVLSLLLARTRTTRVALLSAMTAIVIAGLLGSACAVGVLLEREVVAPRSLSWPLPLGNMSLAVDSLSAWFLLTISLLSIAVATYSIGYMTPGRHVPHHPAPGLFGMFLCLLVASLYLVVCAADVLVFLVGWEVMTLCAFFLVGYDNRRVEVRHGAWMYIIATHLGTALFLLPMFAILIARGGTDYPTITAMLHAAGPGCCALVFALGLLGFGTKAGFMPMHVWLPHAHPAAPTPVSALLSGVVIKTGIYGLMRLLSWMPPLPSWCAWVMLAMGMISGVLGVLYAIAEHDLKRLLAYHSVENIGIIGLGIGMGMLGQTTGQPALATLGYAGALLHVLNHALFKGLLFLSAGAVIYTAGTGEIDRLGGLARKTPLNAMFFLIAAVAICGLPPLNGFVSEWLIYGSLFGGATTLHSPTAILGLSALALMGGLALACFAKVFSVVFLGEARNGNLPAHRSPASMMIAMGILAILCVVVGVLPPVVLPPIRGAVAQLTHSPAASLSDSLRDTLSPLATLSFLAIVFLALAILLALGRHQLLRHGSVASGSAPTWGCGYPFPTPRIQYTASSFAWSLISSFRRWLWPQRHLRVTAGYFPTGGELTTHTSDIAETDFFTPLFHGVAHGARMIRTVSISGQLSTPPQSPKHQRLGPFRIVQRALVAAMRRGNIQTCVTYIVLVLVILVLIEAVWTPRSAPLPTSPARHLPDPGGPNP